MQIDMQNVERSLTVQGPIAQPIKGNGPVDRTISRSWSELSTGYANLGVQIPPHHATCGL